MKKIYKTNCFSLEVKYLKEIIVVNIGTFLMDGCVIGKIVLQHNLK